MLSVVDAWPLGLSASSVSSFYADIDAARWVTDSSIFECRLTQQIPGLGEAVFHHQAGASPSFYLYAPTSPMAEGRALLMSQPPLWRQDLAGRDLGYVDVVASQRPVELDAARSRLVLAELGRGMVPALMRRAWFSDTESVHIGLSPVNFGGAYAEYHQCAATLLPVNFAQIERSTVFWQPNQSELGDEARRLLDNIILYTQADPGIYAL